MESLSWRVRLIKMVGKRSCISLTGCICLRIYKGIAAAWGGQYINLTQSAENVFYVNPFHVPDAVPDIDRYVAEKAELAYAICEQALKSFHENNGIQFRVYAFA